MESKICTRCEVVRARDEWYDSQWKHGWCKPCMKSYYREKNRPEGITDDPRPCIHCGVVYRPKAQRFSVYCSRACNEAYRKDSGRGREGHLNRKYGISQSDYDDLLDAQGGGCAFCGKSAGDQKRYKSYLHVDHDHKTGRVRGLLCDQCNLALGRLGDSVDRIRSILSYLEAV